MSDTVKPMNRGPYFVLTDGKGAFWEVFARSEKLRIVGNLLEQPAPSVSSGEQP